MNTVKTRKSSTLGSRPKAVLEKQGQVARIASGISVFDVAKILTFTMPNFWFSPKYRSKQWDGKVRFLRGKLFPVGFVDRVVNNLSIPVDVIDLNSRCVVDLESFHNFVKKADLRDYQKDAVFEGITKKIGIINLAANAGKSRCIAGILSAFPDGLYSIWYGHRPVYEEYIGRWTFHITEDTEDTEDTEHHLFTDNLEPDLVKKWFSLTKHLDKGKDGILHRILEIELHPIKKQ